MRTCDQNLKLKLNIYDGTLKIIIKVYVDDFRMSIWMFYIYMYSIAL